MNWTKLVLLLGLTAMMSCEKDLHDITETEKIEPKPPVKVEVTPVDINKDGFEFLEKMQGHWVGKNKVVNLNYPWFGWDFRAISKSHLHGIHEGGSFGNLFTSFFVTDFKGKRTLMSRNGGLLKGIYRTSYFVMDKIEVKGAADKTYRFVDAIGGEDVMSMIFRFKQDSLIFNAYTSNLGTRLPTHHMLFRAKKANEELAYTAAQAFGFPKNELDQGLDFAKGFVETDIYKPQGVSKPKSATFLAQGSGNDVYDLAPLSGDPYKITDHPTLGTVSVSITRNNTIQNDNLILYLSKKPLTDNQGYLNFDPDALNTILHFPTLDNLENEFMFTYIHPGDYYLTIVADKNQDGAPSTGDVLSISHKFTLTAKENEFISVTNIDVQN
ncbi:MAG: hypothetical protein N4A45_07585 [Flavobacteriales bacterium]|jgi:hypothetical protein|nr:hypothetical protein [Flavobacteriales bacterium]